MLHDNVWRILNCHECYIINHCTRYHITCNNIRLKLCQARLNVYMQLRMYMSFTGDFIKVKLKSFVMSEN